MEPEVDHFGDVGIVRDATAVFRCSFTRRLRRATISSPVLVSRFPVGSSATNDGRIVRQGPADGSPLLLPAGDAVRPVSGSLPQPYRLQELGEA